MKSYGIAQLQAFLDAAALEQPLKRSLILLATSDEESDSTLGTQWVIRQHPELTDRFWVVLTEGGLVEALNPEDIKYWGIENAQLQIVPATACSASRERLEAFVEDLTTWQAQAPLRVTRELRDFVASYGPTRAYPRWRNHVARPDFMLRNRWGYDHLPPLVRELFRNQVTISPVEPADGGGYALRMKLLLLPGTTTEEAVTELLPEWLIQGVSLAIGEPLGASHGSPTDHPVFEAMVDSLRGPYPQAPIGGIFLAATATDARFFRAAGIPSYGYSPFLFFTTDTWRVDRINERIPLPGFVTGVEIYSNLVRRLVTEPTN
jgi:acetylornithine deacetylase/succinyl-diaminopimelate desuccinylase-like protein